MSRDNGVAGYRGGAYAPITRTSIAPAIEALDVSVQQNGPTPGSSHGGTAAITDAASVIIAADPTRVFLEVQNDGGEDCFLLGTDDTAGVRLYPTASRVYRFEEGCALEFSAQCLPGKSTTVRHFSVLRS